MPRAATATGLSVRTRSACDLGCSGLSVGVSGFGYYLEILIQYSCVGQSLIPTGSPCQV